MRAENLCLLQYLDLRNGSRPAHLQILKNIHYTAYTMEVTKEEGYRETCFCLPTTEGQKKKIGKKIHSLDSTLS
jgi:hypothetical protein